MRVDCPEPENKKPATGREYGSSKTGDYAEGTSWLGLVVAIGLEPILVTGISIMPNTLA